MKTTTTLLSLASSLVLVSNGSAFVVTPSSAEIYRQLAMRTNDASEETFNGWYKGYYECIYNIPSDYPHGKPILPWDRTQVNAAAGPKMTTSADKSTPAVASASGKNVPERVPM